MRTLASTIAIAVVAAAGIAIPPETRPAKPTTRPTEALRQSRPGIDTFLPNSVAPGGLEAWQRRSDRDPTATIMKYTFTRLEYGGCVFWVVEFDISGGALTDKSIALYAPDEDGSYLRSLLAHTNSSLLAIELDPGTGLLEMRRAANNDQKDEVVLSCSLQAIGTQYSLGRVWSATHK